MIHENIRYIEIIWQRWLVRKCYLIVIVQMASVRSRIAGCSFSSMVWWLANSYFINLHRQICVFELHFPVLKPDFIFLSYTSISLSLPVQELAVQSIRPLIGKYNHRNSYGFVAYVKNKSLCSRDLKYKDHVFSFICSHVTPVHGTTTVYVPQDSEIIAINKTAENIDDVLYEYICGDLSNNHKKWLDHSDKPDEEST